MMQSRLGEGFPSSWQTTGSRAVPLPISPCERYRTQQTNGRRKLTAELANDAANSLNWLAAESMDKKHSALWRHLCDETFDVSRQGTDAALSALVKGMPDYSASSPGNSASCKKTTYGIWSTNNSE